MFVRVFAGIRNRGKACGSCGKSDRSGEYAHRTELGAPPPAQLDAGNTLERLQRVPDRRTEQPRRLVRAFVGASLGLRDDPVDDTQLEAVSCIGLECRRSLALLARVTPEDRGAALG